ncbi:hypothetical protein PIROE2DRAFT_17924 [Piromyces sp. E2]|nr:hypothetical protein PIROE2DRAFT_17924 [Piromyces sp. E2]|eukprot:OUM57164.1 hypothetical protein PIROE2DRAFT_17924 [Piromyces sp. E2]
MVYTLDSGNSFNKYAQENNLNTTIKLNIFSDNNSTYALTNMGNMVEILLQRKPSKYDLFFSIIPLRHTMDHIYYI